MFLCSTRVCLDSALEGKRLDGLEMVEVVEAHRTLRCDVHA